MPRPSGVGSGPSGVRGPEARDRPERARAHAGGSQGKISDKLAKCHIGFELARCPELRLAALLFRWGVVLPLLQDLAATSLNPIHLIGKGKPSLREQRKTFLQGCFAG